MKIESKNLHDPQHAELEVTIGLGCNRDEPAASLTYHISPRGVSIDRCATDGAHSGGVDLDLTMLDVLCRVSGTPRDAVVATRAKLFPAYEARLHDQHQLAKDVDQLRDLAIEALDRNPGLSLASVAPALLRVLEAFAATQPHPAEESTGCATRCGGRCASGPKPVQPVVRKMKTPEGCAAFTGEELAERMMRICGCQGRHDCDCVSINNQARVELWTEYNTQRLKQA